VNKGQIEREGRGGRGKIKVKYVQNNPREINKPQQNIDINQRNVQNSKPSHGCRGHEETLGRIRRILNDEEFLSHRYKSFPFLPKNIISSGWDSMSKSR